MDSEQIKRLFRAITRDDKDAIRQLALETIENEKQKKHHLLAKELESILRNNSYSANINGSRTTPPIPRDNEKGYRLLDVNKYYLDWKDIVLSDSTENLLKQIVEENQKETLLASYGLKPKNKILFFGPPGTGKTLTAKVISSVIGYPLVLVRFDSVISSFLGETASNLRKIFDYIESEKWVVLFDEFDIIGKQRDDPTEHGEIKRVVNNFMLMLENYQGDSLIISSTNHPQLLDVAVWRRFDDAVYFALPDEKQRMKIFDKYLRVMKKDISINISEIARRTDTFSGADIEQTCVEALKKEILRGSDILRESTIYESIQRQRERLSRG